MTMRIALLACLTMACTAAAQDAQLLAEFRKTKADVTSVHIMAEQPLLVAVEGPQGTRQTPAGWGQGQLLGIFAHRGERIVTVAIVPNDGFRSAVWIDRQDASSITFRTADDDYGFVGDSLKVFFDPQTYFPKKIMRFTPVRCSRITVAAGLVTVVGTDGIHDFTARQRGGTWRVTTSLAVAPAPVPSTDSGLQVPAMPVSTLGEFREARPVKAQQQSNEIDEKIGPYQRVGSKLWVGKTFYDGEGSVGVGDIGYFDRATSAWVFLHIPEMADWSTSALLVEPDAVWAGLLRQGEGSGDSGGLLRYDLASHKVTRYAIPDGIEKIVRVGKAIYCGTSGGFAVVDQEKIQRFEFTPQLDSSYTVEPSGNL